MRCSPSVLVIALLAWQVGATSLDAQTAPPALKASLSPTSIPADQSVAATFELVNVGPDEAGLTNRNTTITIVPPGQVDISCNEGEVDPKSWGVSEDPGGGCSLAPSSRVDFERDAKLSLKVPLKGRDTGVFEFEVSAVLDDRAAVVSPDRLPIDVTKPSPTIQFSASDYILASGSRIKLIWKVTCPSETTCHASLQVGNQPPTAVDLESKGWPVTPSATTTYTLSAEGDEVDTASKSLTVHVPSAGFGWLQLPTPEDLPVPTVLMSDLRQARLYAVLVRLEDGQPKEPTLFRLDPDLRWTAIETSYEACTGGVEPGLPPGMETSSGVYYDGDRTGRGALYLLGGSVAFNGRVSNDVWRLPLSAGADATWTQLLCGREERPAPRSGQTVVVHQDTIWMLGGYDELSRSLQEVWTFSDGWKRLDAAGFPARGLLAAVSLKKSSELWVLGGFSGYQQQPFVDFWILDSSGWRSIDRFNAPFERPAATALGSTDGNRPAFLSASYQKEPRNFVNTSWKLTAKGETVVQGGSTPDFNFTGESDLSTYFALQTVPFGGAMCGRALGATNTWPQQLQGHEVLFCFVPQTD